MNKKIEKALKNKSLTINKISKWKNVIKIDIKLLQRIDGQLCNAILCDFSNFEKEL